MSPTHLTVRAPRAWAHMASSDGFREIKQIAAPPFPCICTLRYYDANSLLNQHNFWLL